LRWWDYPAYWHKPSFGSQTADFATDLGHDGTLFLGSKINGLWRSTPKVLDSVYQASITKHYTSCTKMGIEINGEQYQTGKNYLQPKANPQDPDTLIYVEFVPAIDTSINLVLCHSHYLLYRDKNYYEGNYQEVWPSVDGCDTLANIQVSSILDTTIVETFYGWHGETMEYGGQTYSFPWTTFTDKIYDQNGCDSVNYRLELLSKTTRETLPILVACANDTVLYNGMAITESNIYRDTAFTTMGFDSVYYYQPIYFSPSSVKNTVTHRFLCTGDTLQINNLLIDAPGNYVIDTVVSGGGCDINYQVLSVEGVATQSLAFSVSSGDTVAGVQIWTDTLFTQVVPSVEYGCDSLVTEYNVHVVLANEDLVYSKIKIYPNPARDWLRFEQVRDYHRVEIVDLLGESHGRYPITDSNLDIRLEGYSSGIYYAVFYKETGIAVLKFEVAP